MAKDDVTWYQISRWWPILGAVIAITISYTALITQISVLNNKLDNAIALLQTYQDKEEKVITNLNDLNKRTIVLETEHKNIIK